MSTAAQRSAALTERLQRLKAGLGKPRQLNSDASPEPLTRGSDVPAISRPDRSRSQGSGPPSEDYEHLPTLSTHAKDPSVAHEKPLESTQEQPGCLTAVISERPSLDSEFEMVTSPHEAVKTVSGGSPASSSSPKAAEPEVEATPETFKREETQMQKEATELKQMLQEEKEVRADLAAQMSALRSAYVEARDAGEAASEEVERLQSECQTLRSRLQEATSASLKQAREEEASNVRRRVERAEQAIEKERAAVVRLEQQLAESRKQVRQSADASKHVQELEHSLQELLQKASKTSQEIQRMRLAASTQAQDLQEAQQQILALKEQLESAKAETKSSAAMTARLAQSAEALKSDMDSLGAENERIRAENEGLAAENRGLRAENDRLQEQLWKLEQLQNLASLTTRAEEQQAGPDQVAVLASDGAARTSSGGVLPDPQAPLRHSRSTDAHELIPLHSTELPEPVATSFAAAVPEAATSKQEDDSSPGPAGGHKRQPGWGLWAYISGADRADPGPATPLNNLY